MKIHLFKLSILVLLSACNIINDDLLEPTQYGIMFRIDNYNESSFENTKVIIGGVDQNNEFITIDAFNLPLLPGKESSEGNGFFRLLLLEGFDNKRWQPDFNLIREIGDGKAYFQFQFENEDSVFIEHVIEEQGNLYLNLIKYPEVKDNFGELKIRIGNNSEEMDKTVKGYVYTVDFN